jgi:predicted permease
VAYDNVVARVRAGRTIDQVRAELDVVSSQLRRDYPATNDGWAATAETLRDSIVGGFGRASWLFLFAVAGVLLAACANVAGLLTARALNRRRDTGIRIALGASVRQLAQLWICEALVLAVAGGAVGVALAAALVGLLRAASPQGLPRVEDIAVDWPVLAVAAAAILFAALVSGLTPLIVTSSRTSAAALGAGTGRFEGTPARRRFGAVLVAMQCAAALALVMLSVVFGRSFLKLTSTDLGWQPEGVLSLHVYPRAAFLTPAPSLPFQDWAQRVVARLEAIPGIARAAVTSVTPFSSYDHPAEIARGATALADEPRWPIGLHVVSQGYFDALGIRLIRGRAFRHEDRWNEDVLEGRSRPGPGVAIVTESVARTLWPGQEALGQQIRVPGNDTTPFREVVGVVADVQFTAVGAAPALHVFFHWPQARHFNPSLVVRAVDDAAAITPAVRAALLAEDPGTGIDRVSVVDTLVDRALAPARLTTMVIAALGGLALLLAAVGVYGSGGARQLAPARDRHPSGARRVAASDIVADADCWPLAGAAWRRRRRGAHRGGDDQPPQPAVRHRTTRLLVAGTGHRNRRPGRRVPCARPRPPRRACGSDCDAARRMSRSRRALRSAGSLW